MWPRVTVPWWIAVRSAGDLGKPWATSRRHTLSRVLSIAPPTFSSKEHHWSCRTRFCWKRVQSNCDSVIPMTEYIPSCFSCFQLFRANMPTRTGVGCCTCISRLLSHAPTPLPVCLQDRLMVDAPKRHKVSVHVLSREMESCECLHIFACHRSS